MEESYKIRTAQNGYIVSWSEANDTYVFQTLDDALEHIRKKLD